MPSLRGAVRLRVAVPQVPAGSLPSPRRTPRAQAPAAARPVRRVTWLTRGGAVAALVVGGAAVWGTGWRGLALLLAFFVSGSLLTRGGGRRNARQVLANGGVAAVAALLGAWPAFAGALAAAAGDTWATEIGAFSSSPPRLITNGAPVPRGANGGITLLGTAGGVLGAAIMGGLTWMLGPSDLRLAGVVGVAGIAGMLI